MRSTLLAPQSFATLSSPLSPQTLTALEVGRLLKPAKYFQLDAPQDEPLSYCRQNGLDSACLLLALDMRKGLLEIALHYENIAEKCFM